MTYEEFTAKISDHYKIHEALPKSRQTSFELRVNGEPIGVVVKLGKQEWMTAVRDQMDIRKSRRSAFRAAGRMLRK